MDSWAFSVPKGMFYILYIVRIIQTIFTTNQLVWKIQLLPMGEYAALVQMNIISKDL